MNSSQVKLYISCMLIALITVMFSNLDILISQYFYTGSGSFPAKESDFNLFVEEDFPVIIAGLFALLCGFWAGGKICKDSVFAIKNKTLLYIIITFTLIPIGLVQLMKFIWQRPRPFMIEQFGGNEEFVSPLVISNNFTDISGSFPSGHTAVAFWLLAIALIMPKPLRRKSVILTIIIGIVVAFNRVSGGYHFASDTIFSAVIISPAIVFAWHLFRFDTGNKKDSNVATPANDTKADLAKEGEKDKS